MKSLWDKLHKIGDIFHLPDLPKWMCGLLALVLILRTPSFFEPYNYGDEMIYLTLGQGIRQGVPLYSGIYDNKPPLLYLTAALAGNLFWFKAILAFWNIATIVIFWKLSRILFKDKTKMQVVSTAIFALLSTLPTLEGNIVNAELFMIGPVILAFLILLGKALSPKRILLAGSLFGIAALFKIPAAFDLLTIVGFWLITDIKNTGKVIKNSAILAAGFAVPVLLTFILYFLSGALPEYLTAAFLQNVGYLKSLRPPIDVPISIRGLVVLSGILIVFFSRKKLSDTFIFVALWALFALFAVTLSQRPYPHYLIQVLSPLSLLLSVFFVQKTVEQSLAVLPLTLIFFVPVFYRFWIYPTSSYYLRFVNLATGRIDRETYLKSFSKTAPRNYKIADFLASSSRSGDRVFMWDPDSPVVYALSRRLPPIKYTVPYHVNDYSGRTEVADQIAKNPPKFIILTSGNPFSELTIITTSKYLLIAQIEDADIYSRIDFAEAREK